MRVKDRSAAWQEVDKIFPGDYQKDYDRSASAGYPVYWTTVESGSWWISDLGDRLEVNLPDRTINIWIDKEPENNNLEVRIIMKDGQQIFYPKSQNAIVKFVDNGCIKFYNVISNDGQWVSSFRIDQIESITIKS